MGFDSISVNIHCDSESEIIVVAKSSGDGLIVRIGGNGYSHAAIHLDRATALALANRLLAQLQDTSVGDAALEELTCAMNE